MTLTKVSVQDQQGLESAYSDPKTKRKYIEKYTKYKQCIKCFSSAVANPVHKG